MICLPVFELWMKKSDYPKAENEKSPGRADRDTQAVIA
jgi:hypothetical protein